MNDPVRNSCREPSEQILIKVDCAVFLARRIAPHPRART